MTQLSIFENKEKIKPILEYDVKVLENYLVKNHFGINNAIPMMELASIINKPDRLVRSMVNEIRIYGDYYIVGSNYGYYAVERENYIDNMQLNRSINSIERLVKTNPKILPFFYRKSNELKEEVLEYER